MEYAMTALNGSISNLVEQIIAANPAQAEEAKTNPKTTSWLVGQVIKASGGKANPAAVLELLGERQCAIPTRPEKKQPVALDKIDVDVDLKPVIGKDGNVQLYDIFVTNKATGVTKWIGSRRTEAQCREAVYWPKD